MTRFALIALLPLSLLAGCDRLEERLKIPNPAKIEADAKAIGGACRHAGRGLEDCYQLNPKAPKAAVFEGWKEMNEYMLKNNMQAVPPEFGPKHEEHGAAPEAAVEGGMAETKGGGKPSAQAETTANKAAPDKAGAEKPAVAKGKPHIDLPSRQDLEKAAERPR